MATKLITYGNAVIQYDDAVYSVATAQPGTITFPITIIKISDGSEVVQIAENGTGWWKNPPSSGAFTTIGQFMKVTLP